MNTSPEGNMAPQRGWWSRNWKWVVPVGCLGMLASCGCLGAIVFYAASSAIKSTGAYMEAVQVVMTDEEVREALGTPLDTGMMQGSVKTENNRGTASFTVPLDGPKADGILRVEATKSGEDWEFQVLQVEVPGRPPIDLRDNLGGGGGAPPGGERPTQEEPPAGDEEAGDPQDDKDGSDIDL